MTVLVFIALEPSTTKDRFLKHSDYEGFKGYIIKYEEGNSVGFIYGYISLPGHY
ncbi:hypothetical protein GCM10008932_12380 [Alkalibacterium iburiense]|uniref:Uncharacterized protein n=1 Tax=Alkalibacterium iburiense TaxID=290589 RepID=A0ABN0XE09_9LACT